MDRGTTDRDHGQQRPLLVRGRLPAERVDGDGGLQRLASTPPASPTRPTTSRSPTTVKGAGVDVATLNIIGLSGSLDWGVHAYDPTGANGVDPRNGGIVGSISYDTTRNELDPRYAAAEDWQPGIPDIPVSLYATVPCNDPLDRDL